MAEVSEDCRERLGIVMALEGSEELRQMEREGML